MVGGWEEERKSFSETRASSSGVVLSSSAPVVLDCASYVRGLHFLSSSSASSSSFSFFFES